MLKTFVFRVRRTRKQTQAIVAETENFFFPKDRACCETDKAFLLAAAYLLLEQRASETVEEKIIVD
jgi:hypothetical protein